MFGRRCATANLPPHYNQKWKKQDRNQTRRIRYNWLPKYYQYRKDAGRLSPFSTCRAFYKPAARPCLTAPCGVHSKKWYRDYRFHRDRDPVLDRKILWNVERQTYNHRKA